VQDEKRDTALGITALEGGMVVGIAPIWIDMRFFRFSVKSLTQEENAHCPLIKNLRACGAPVI